VHLARSVALVVAVVSLALVAPLARAQPEGVDGPLLAKAAPPAAKKKAPPKKKRAEDESFAAGIDSSADNDTGVGVHREQEGVDVPYKTEISLNTTTAFLTTTSSGDGEDGKAHGETQIDLGIEWLFVLGSFELGPALAYQSDTTEVSSQASDGKGGFTTSTEKDTSSAYALGGVFKWNFVSLDHKDLVPFAYAGFAYDAGQAKFGDLETKSDGTTIRAGGGANIFLASHIAFNPRGEYQLETMKYKSKDSDGATTTKTSGFRILVGIAAFI
jgi:hypothetical protein